MERRSQPFLHKLAVISGAAFATIAGLECAPQDPMTLIPSKPEIKAEPIVVRTQHPRPRPRVRSNKTWNWPRPAAFQSMVGEVRQNVENIRLVRGKLIYQYDDKRREFDDVVYSIMKEPGKSTYRVWLEIGNDHDASYSMPNRDAMASETPLAEASVGKTLVFSGDGDTLRFEPTYVSPLQPIPAAAINAWTYVATLLAADPFVYDSTPVHPDWEDDRWEQEIAKAKAAKNWSKALSFYRSWRPVGQCSMDTRPAEVARDYAELCYAQGKIGCFLQLQVRIMNNGFDRVAYSGYGDAAANTESERLLDTGIEAEEFFLGLALQFGNVQRLGEMYPYRLARSINEAGVAESTLTQLVAWLEDPAFDAYNRLSLVKLAAALDEEALLDDLQLNDIERKWLEAERKAKQKAREEEEARKAAEKGD